MPSNKKPLIRYQIIDRCIRNTARDYGKEELMQAINNELMDRNLEPVGKVTFYQDIKDMQVEFGAPIESRRVGNRTFFKYTDPDYSFSHQPLNQEEIEHLKDAILIMSRFSGVPGLEWVEELTSKLELGTYQEVRNARIIGFESNEFLVGKEYIGRLFKAIVDRKVLRITYQKFTDSEIKAHLVHPYYLKEYDGRWYLISYLPKRDKLMLLSVDRMQQIEEVTGIDYIENTRWDLMEYFDDIIGVNRGEEKETVQRIVLKFSPLMSKYVKTKPIHGTQRKVTEEADGSLTVAIEVIPNFELENLIFSYKDGVEVVSPPFFRDKIHGLLRDALKHYNDSK